MFRIVLCSTCVIGNRRDARCGFQLQLCAFGIFFCDVIDMVKNGRGQLVNGILICLCRDDNSSLYRDGVDRLCLSRIGIRRNGIGLVVRALGKDFVTNGAVNIDEVDAVCRGKLGNRGGRRTCNDECGINLAVLQRFLRVLERLIPYYSYGGILAQYMKTYAGVRTTAVSTGGSKVNIQRKDHHDSEKQADQFESEFLHFLFFSFLIV